VWDQFRAAMRLQLMFTAAAALLSGWLAGIHGVISASLGGLIGIAGGLAFALVAIRSKAKSPGEVLGSALKAEGVKLSLMIVLLVTVLKIYSGAVVLALVATFMVSAVIFGMGAFARSVQVTSQQKT
jgi:ATP synthase protein I